MGLAAPNLHHRRTLAHNLEKRQFHAADFFANSPPGLEENEETTIAKRLFGGGGLFGNLAFIGGSTSTTPPTGSSSSSSQLSSVGANTNSADIGQAGTVDTEGSDSLTFSNNGVIPAAGTIVGTVHNILPLGSVATINLQSSANIPINQASGGVISPGGGADSGGVNGDLNPSTSGPSVNGGIDITGGVDSSSNGDSSSGSVDAPIRNDPFPVGTDSGPDSASSFPTPSDNPISDSGPNVSTDDSQQTNSFAGSLSQTLGLSGESSILDAATGSPVIGDNGSLLLELTGGQPDTTDSTTSSQNINGGVTESTTSPSDISPDATTSSTDGVSIGNTLNLVGSTGSNLVESAGSSDSDSTSGGGIVASVGLECSFS